MSYSKELYIEAIEQVCEDYAFDRITIDEGLDRLSRLGIDNDEAQTMLSEAVS